MCLGGIEIRYGILIGIIILIAMKTKLNVMLSLGSISLRCHGIQNKEAI